MKKCQISWIDANGDPTPDENEAIGRARITFYDERGYAYRQSKFPICEKHLELMPRGKNYFSATNSYSEWEFIPYFTVCGHCNKQCDVYIGEDGIAVCGLCGHTI